MKHILLHLLFGFICLHLHAQCPLDDIQFLSQQELEDFANTYPNCTQIEGTVEIGMFGLPSDIQSLAPLSQIRFIEGDLRIDSNDNLNSLNGLDSLNSIGGTLNISRSSLTDLSGLDALTTIGGGFRAQFNSDLITLNGLNNLNSIGGDFSFANNSALTTFDGLQQLNNIGGELRLSVNNALTDLSGLEGLTGVDGNLILQFNSGIASLNGLNQLNTIGGNLIVQFSAALASLEALQNLTQIGGYIDIDNNTNLTALTGLDNIDHTTITDLRLFENPNLALCGVPSICNYLENMGTYDIYANATGCNTPQETDCLVSVTQPEALSFAIFPNPARHHIYLQFEDEISDADVRIFDISGKILYQQTVQIMAVPFSLDVSAYPPGVYFLSVTNTQHQSFITKRFVKQ